MISVAINIDPITVHHFILTSGDLALTRTVTCSVKKFLTFDIIQFLKFKRTKILFNRKEPSMTCLV